MNDIFPAREEQFNKMKVSKVDAFVDISKI